MYAVVPPDIPGFPAVTIGRALTLSLTPCQSVENPREKSPLSTPQEPIAIYWPQEILGCPMLSPRKFGKPVLPPVVTGKAILPRKSLLEKPNRLDPILPPVPTDQLSVIGRAALPSAVVGKSILSSLDLIGDGDASPVPTKQVLLSSINQIGRAVLPSGRKGRGLLEPLPLDLTDTPSPEKEFENPITDPTQSPKKLIAKKKPNKPKISKTKSTSKDINDGNNDIDKSNNEDINIDDNKEEPKSQDEEKPIGE